MCGLINHLYKLYNIYISNNSILFKFIPFLREFTKTLELTFDPKKQKKKQKKKKKKKKKKGVAAIR